jgi:hypothetical protein
MSLTSDDTIDGVEAVAPEAAPAWPPSELTLTLRTPVVDAAGSEITELSLHEPTDDEWMAVMAHEVETRRRYAISRIAALPMTTVAKIKIGDVLRAENYLWGFIEVGRATRDW